MDRSRTLEKVGELGLIAIVRGDSRAAALEVVGALVEGSVLGIEITFTTPEAVRVMADLKEEYGDRILLGAGTIEKQGQVEQAVAAGAAFLVSPGCDPDLVSRMRDTGLAVMPGALTPSEIMLAQRLGADAVKQVRTRQAYLLTKSSPSLAYLSRASFRSSRGSL